MLVKGIVSMGMGYSCREDSSPERRGSSSEPGLFRKRAMKVTGRRQLDSCAKMLVLLFFSFLFIENVFHLMAFWVVYCNVAFIVAD